MFGLWLGLWSSLFNRFLGFLRGIGGSGGSFHAFLPFLEVFHRMSSFAVPVSRLAIAIQPLGIFLRPTTKSAMLAMVVPGPLTPVVVQKPARFISLPTTTVLPITIAFLAKVFVFGRTLAVPWRSLLFPIPAEFFTKAVTITSVIGTKALARLTGNTSPCCGLRVVPPLREPASQITEVTTSGRFFLTIVATPETPEAFVSLEPGAVTTIVVENRRGDARRAYSFAVELITGGSASGGGCERHFRGTEDHIFRNCRTSEMKKLTVWNACVLDDLDNRDSLKMDGRRLVILVRVSYSRNTMSNPLTHEGHHLRCH
jgi:hypothetical protein